ncbi:PhnD/SsuA/transferrin family substrate-binding protein [Prosthecodimorpha staleyi]|nr:PhnD/SsuA/transferrin family substrate-binding protein [Prosthecodimorpha staleyi]
MRLLSLAPLIAAGPHVGRSQEKEIRFGLTPVFLTSDLELLASLKSYLERATGSVVKLVSRRIYQEITSLLLSGQLDAAWICGFPFVANADRLDLVAVPVWRGGLLYQSYLIAGRSHAGTRIEDLTGDIHAFSDPDSNSGWLVTAAALARLGTTPGRFFRQTFFTYGHRNVIRAVSSGLAASGSVDGYVYEVMSEVEAALVAETRVVVKSAWLGFPPVACASSQGSAPHIVRLREALTGMSQDHEGQKALSI